MPSTKAIKNFIREVRKEHDKRIADSLGGGELSFSGAIILPTVASSVSGGLWLDVTDSPPVLKLFYGGTEYVIGEATISGSD